MALRKAWKPIKGFEGLYEISTSGEVKSFVKLKEKILRPGLCKNGYLTVVLYRYRHGKSYYVHRLVAETFIPNVFGKPEVNHLDGNKRNNGLRNIEWCTKSENGRHAYDTGLNYSNPQKGESCATHVLSERQVKKIKTALFLGITCARLGRLFGVDRTTISSIKNEKSWKHITI